MAGCGSSRRRQGTRCISSTERYSALHLSLIRPQAAAAARIVGKPGIREAAQNGDVALVRDHIIADPACVHLKNKWGYDPSNMQHFYENECDIAVYFQSSNPFS